MDTKKDSKRKKDKQNDHEDRRKEKKSRRHRSRSRSAEDRDTDSRRKRKHSRSRSPNVPLKQEKRVEREANDDAVKKDAPVRKAKETDMLNTRTGGAYIPPARLRMMQAQITDKSSVAYQRLAWEALKKSIHGHINKINVGNIGIIIKELLKENIVRGRGLLCRSVIQAQAASPTFTNVYAALVAAVNSRFPNIGELLLKRLVIQFKRGFKRNDKPICISAASFIAHLVNQRVAHEILALELLTLLVESPTDDSVEVAIAFLKECGQKLTEVSSKGVNAIFEMLRNILHEGQLDKRVQYMIEVMFQVWKDGFKDHPALIEELELVPEEEQFTHLLMLDDATDPQDILNVFKFDDKYEDNEQKYKNLSKEILGSDAESGEEDGSEESGSEESDDDEEQEGEQKAMTIIDNTETNLVALRRTIYLTINSSLDFEECAHKLMKMQLKPGQEVELCHMFLDCCAEQRTYEKFYGLLAQRFCNINRMYIGPFEDIFKDSYATAHRLDTNRLRNVSKFFAHLLFTDSISWEVMECVKLNEEDTTSSSRIYIKILFQELAEYMGLKKLNDRLKDPTLQSAFSGIFPRDNPKNTRFSINFFTSIGLGGLTDELREHLKQMPKNVPAPVTDINVESDSSSDSSSSSSSSDSSSDSSSSDSEDEGNKKKSKKSKEKDKSKQSDSRNEEDSNKEKNDTEKERWGHDGFYNTYGDNAKRHENRPEQSEQGRDNFAKPRDVSRRFDDREKQNANVRGNRDDRYRDGYNERGNRDDRYRDGDNERGNRDDRYRDGDRRRHDRGTREEVREIQKETDVRSRREHDRRNDNTADRRNERNSRDDNRYDRDRLTNRNNGEDQRRIDDNDRRSRDEDNKQLRNQERDRDEDCFSRSDKRNDDRSRDRNTEREKREKGRNDRDQRRDREEDSVTRSNENSDNKSRDQNAEKEKRDNRRDRDVQRDRDEESNNRSNKDNDDRSRKRDSERDRRDKDSNRINRARDDEKKRDNREDLSTKTKDKNSQRDERDNRSAEKNDDRGKYSNGTSKKDKYSDSSEEDDLRSRRKDKKQESTRSKEIEQQNNKENRSKKDNKNKDNKKNKHKSKKSKQESSDESDSSSDSEESDSESDDSEIENKQRGRYWDTFDIKNRETVQTQTNNDKRTSKSKKSERRRER